LNSVWFDDCKLAPSKTLDKDLKTDVAIIGAGMAGILTSYLLKERGISSVIIEASEVASGVTGKTTAKITSQHNLFYDKLIKNFGEEKAKQYADANQAAIAKYSDIVTDNQIDCDYKVCSAFVYSQNDVLNIEKEVDSTKKLGLPAGFTTQTELPFDVKGAIEFQNQAQFHPLKFIRGIMGDLDIYEKTQAVEIDKDKIITDKGNIYAKNIVIATHYPTININSLYFAKISQKRSYLLALEDAASIQGMYIGENDTGYSFRSYDKYLLFGGEGHRTGDKDENDAKYEKLIRKAKEYYPGCEMKSKWSAQDCVTLDEIPYIGNYSKSTPNIYVATGFNKWGMTSSMVSAMLLSDKIEGKENKNAEIFSPNRFNLSASYQNIAENVKKTLKSFTIDKMKAYHFDLEKLEMGQAKTIIYKDEKVGVYKNEDGELFMVSTKCPHLGCELAWNRDDLSWDCPCHGSRFDYKGSLIDNPASRGIEIEKL
jgi:glycine/D-amino acid oxidase-like deaminating enzyme/nitrite reductase/ring-hydroxylating ferredoxin subunit